MLLLRRKIGESVIIDGGRIVAKLIKIDADECTIGFAAPSVVEIEREERFYRKLRHASAVNDPTPPPATPTPSEDSPQTHSTHTILRDRGNDDAG
jgi:carbon storage regulator CsrA